MAAASVSWQGNGNRGRCWHGRWRDDVTADWEQLVSDELEATVIQFSGREVPTTAEVWRAAGAVKATLPAAGVALFVGLLLCFRLLWVALLWERGEEGQGVGFN